MRILAVTSWGGACGIANYAEQMIAATTAADPTLEFTPSVEALDPFTDLRLSERPDALWLNYHRGLHSRWTPVVLQAWKAEKRLPVVLTFHDTYGERPPDDLTQRLHDLADAFIVHEPCEGLPKSILIRQGVPAGSGGLQFYFPPYLPILGTAGFNFPWKNFDRLAEVTAAAGWAYVVCSNNATEADEARWQAANPFTHVLRGFQPTETLVSYLAGCDATCWAYECGNSGTSGAIRLGLAARKPVIAWEHCRQFRDLNAESEWDIRWCKNFDHLPTILRQVPIQRVDSGIVYLAHRDSWVQQGRRYAEIFRSLL